MKPRRFPQKFAPNWRVLAIGSCILWSASGGCVGRFLTTEPEKLTEVETEISRPDDFRLVGDVAIAYGMNYQKVEGVGLVRGLAGTGSDPPPSPQRQALIDEMQTHNVSKPNKLLADPETSLVMVRSFLPPGVQKGDRLDLEVRIPPRSETTSLRGGWLMQARLREMEILGGAIRTGHVIALAEGNVLVDAVFNGSEDKVLQTRGRILGGGVSQTTRSLGLVMRPDFSSVRSSATMGSAINNRFHTFDHGKKVGVAKPKRDNYIEILLHPRYKHNVWRYMRVIRQIPLRDTPAEHMARLQMLDKKLLEPTTAPTAALQLEALGREAIPSLKKGLTSPEAEVRFCASEALAYLDEAEAAGALEEAARDSAAFRWAALTALSTMDHVSAYDALSNLLHVASAETRYGAFRAIRERNPHDPLVRGEIVGADGVSFHVVATSGEPLVHFAKSQRAEIVLFGADLRMLPPKFLYAGKDIMIVKGVDDQQVKLIRYRPGKEDQLETCSTEVAQIIPAIFRLGGNYADVMQAVQQARNSGDLSARIAVDAVPRPGRVYHRDSLIHKEMDAESSDDREEDQTGLDGSDGKSQFEEDDPNRYQPDFNLTEEQRQKRGFFGKMQSWFSADPVADR